MQILPNFVVPETTTRERGESAPVALDQFLSPNLLLTLNITHAVEQESIDVDVFTSADGRSWSAAPAITFLQKSYCGTYPMIFHHGPARFIKAAWRSSRWRHNTGRPFFRFSMTAEPAPARAMTAGHAPAVLSF